MFSTVEGKINEIAHESISLDAEGNGRFKIDKHGKVKYPRRLIHCSDGILEEYSTDEEDDEPSPDPPLDTSKLTWGPYLWYYTVRTAFGGLAVCDYLGEKLAYLFGITSPRFQYAISEAQRMQEEEMEEKQLDEEERMAENKIIQEALSLRKQRNAVTLSNDQGDGSTNPTYMKDDQNSFNTTVTTAL